MKTLKSLRVHTCSGLLESESVESLRLNRQAFKDWSPRGFLFAAGPALDAVWAFWQSCRCPSHVWNTPLVYISLYCLQNGVHLTRANKFSQILPGLRGHKVCQLFFWTGVPSMTYLVQNICLQAREGEKKQLKDGKSCRHTQRFGMHPGGIPEVRWHRVQHTEPDQDALHGFVCLPDSWTQVPQVPQVFQAPQHSTRAVMAACVSILSLLMSFLFCTAKGSSQKCSVWHWSFSQGSLGRSFSAFVQSLRQIL